MGEPYLIFMAHSKYSGRCKEKGCQNTWDEGEQCYWNPRTRETFCADCGEELNEQSEDANQ
jgi:hypothetical protein